MHPLRIATTAALGALIASPAFAHIGQHQGWGLSSGILHPLLGWDHLLAMLALGLWAGMVRGPLGTTLLMAFPAGMIAGAMLGIGGIALSGAEWGIGLSGVMLGALVWRSHSLPALLSVMIAAGFGLCHGYAHGAEMPVQASVAAYVTGFLGSTVLLHLAGYIAARAALIHAQPKLLRLAGVAVALMSGTLLVVG